MKMKDERWRGENEMKEVKSEEQWNKKQKGALIHVSERPIVKKTNNG